MISKDTRVKIYVAESKKKGASTAAAGVSQEIPAAFSYSCFNKSAGPIAGTGGPLLTGAKHYTDDLLGKSVDDLRNDFQENFYF